MDTKTKIRCQPFFGRDPVTGFMVERYVDEYAEQTGREWKCDNYMFCARGFTPEHAWDELSRHMEWMFNGGGATYRAQRL